MKKVFLGVLTAALVLSLGTTSAFACYHGGCGSYAGSPCGVNFVDADGDGICDNCSGAGCGVNYVDADGDGVCDNYAAAGQGRGCGRGRGRGRHCR